jgi:hypothetical protein
VALVLFGDKTLMVVLEVLVEFVPFIMVELQMLVAGI